jgi:hypothetical protein
MLIKRRQGKKNEGNVFVSPVLLCTCFVAGDSYSNNIARSQQEEPTISTSEVPYYTTGLQDQTSVMVWPGRENQVEKQAIWQHRQLQPNNIPHAVTSPTLGNRWVTINYMR